MKDDGTRLAAEAAAAGADIVAAAGGDGTYCEVVNGLLGTDAIMGILPLGTGNDFSRHLGLNTDLDHAVDTLFKGAPKPVDVGETQGRYFLNVAGCGFDGAAAERVNRGFRQLHGTAAYVAGVLQCLITFKPASFRITLDGETIARRAMMCTVANSSSYGGGMMVAPNALIDDGLFDICLLKEFTKPEFIWNFPRVFKGTHTTHPKVEMRRAEHILVETDRPLPVLVDGDVVGTTPVEFKMHKHAIRVMTPRCEVT
jgi:diacylglycerol kinase (ATP)